MEQTKSHLRIIEIVVYYDFYAILMKNFVDTYGPIRQFLVLIRHLWQFKVVFLHWSVS